MWSSHSTSFIILFDPSDSATFFHRQGQNGPTCWTWVPQGFLLSIVFLVLAKAVFTLCVIPGDCQLQDLSVLTCHFQIQCYCTWLFRLLSPDVKPSHFYVLILICHIFTHLLWLGWSTNSSPQLYPPVTAFELNGSVSDCSYTKAIFLDPLGKLFELFKEAVEQFHLWYCSPEDFHICIWQFCY